ncbi:YncE family protein [Pseudomonas sp. NFACC43]|uniref:YncE family protein n=1 Tax=Pseudomonas sp. NFACC43 TaxID=1566203 RepID=UPI000922F243|nr:YncE family protein [Pseudomonas sp. NFACC43]SFX02857.1 DNA-binding beta-propeller fold protein YncE [Pseudomonas sp. NFACC43]
MPPSSTPADQTVLLEKPDLPRATRPVVGGDFGVPKHIYDQEPAGCKVVVLPYTNQTGGENVSINLNGETNIDNRDTLGTDDTVELYIRHGKLLANAVNRLTYTIRRLSGVVETSDPPAEILYNEFRPGLFDRTPGDGAHSELELILPDEIKNGVGPGFTRATVCVSYPYCRAHDRIWLNCNGKPKYHTVPDTEAPSPPDPGSPTPTTICFDVTSADLGDDHAQFMFSFTVTDQLGNSPDLNSPWSAVQTVDVDQAGLRLPVPIPREIASDTADDPGIIDLEKLGTNPLLLIVLTSDPRFLPGDTIEATYVAKVVGQPEVTHSETGTVETDGFGQKQACVLEIPNDKVISGSTVQASYKLFRGTTLVGTSKTAHATVIGAAQNLLPPSVKEANGPILNPVQAKDALHIVVPANAALLPDDKLKVTWTGAAGTPAGGSHTSGEWPIRDGWEVPIPNSVVAFNLGKSVTVTYTVIQNGVESPPSDPFVLNVQALSQDDLLVARPRILQAANNGEGAELDVATLTGNATVRIDAWPLIAQGQYVWLRLKGKNNDGTDYERVLWSSALGSRVSASWVSSGFATNTVPLTELRGLRNGSALTVEFKVTLNQSIEESQADTFPLRTYTVKAMEWLTPTLTDIRDSKGSVVGGSTVETSVTVTGTGHSGERIQLMDGTVNIGNPVPISAGGTTWSTPLTGLTVKAYSLKARGLYGSEPESAASTFTVITLSEAHKPYIQQAENNGTGATLDLAAFGGDATVKANPWPGIAVGQKVWLRCLGKKANGEDHHIPLYAASAVTTLEVRDGLSKSLARAQLELLGNNTELTVELKVTFNGSSVEEGATVFPVRIYNVIVRAPVSIDVGISPTRHALSPDGAYLYVCVFDARKIVVVNTVTHAVIRTVDSPEPTRGPADISISPDGRCAYVLLSTYLIGGPHSIRVLDLTTHSFTGAGTIPYNTTNAIALTKNGAQLYAMSYGFISVYNLMDFSIIGEILLNGRPDDNFITFSPSGARGYSIVALGHGPSTVEVIDTATHSKSGSINIPNEYATSLTISPDGSRAYIGHQPRTGGSEGWSVSVLDMATERIITTISMPLTAVPDTTLKIVASVDGTRVYLYGDKYRQIGVISTATLTPMPSIPIPDDLTGKGVYHITHSSTGPYLYASMAAGDQVYIVPINS